MEDGRLEAVPLEDIDRAEDDWRRLGRYLESPYLTWEWASTWWRHFGSCELRLVGCRTSEGELRAILPLYRVAGRVRALRLVGHGHAGELGPVCHPSDAPAALTALGRYLRDGPADWDVLLAQDVPPAQGWSAHVGARFLDRTSTPLVDLGGLTWDTYLRTRTKSFRDDLRKNTRRLERSGALTYRTTRVAHELGADLDALFSLHVRLWGAAASPYFSGSEAFHRDFAAQALERGWLRLALLELDGRPIAANYGFRLGATAWTYNAGRDRSVTGSGLLMTALDIEHAVDEGARAYHLGRGASTFKDRFATAAAEVETVGVSRGLVGRASLTVRRYTRSLPPRARSWLERVAT